MDKDGDGFISREEFIAPQTRAFEFLDKDRDGKVSTAEFAEGRPAALAVLANGGPLRVAGVGPNGDPMAVLSGEGGRMMFVRRGSMVASGAGPVIDGNISVHRIPGSGSASSVGLDKNGDGKISKDEFDAPVREAFERMDTDHSGSIDPGESASGAGVRILTSRISAPAD